jgi:hypothetical protein
VAAIITAIAHRFTVAYLLVVRAVVDFVQWLCVWTGSEILFIAL